MIINENLDKVLWLTLASDKKNRMGIANLIYSLPKEIIERIKIELQNKEVDGKLQEIEFSKAIGNFMDGLSLFNVRIYDNNLKIKLSRFNQNGQNSEEIYELDMILLPIDQIMDRAREDIIYIGSYFCSNTNSVLGTNFMFARSDGAGYELYIDVDNRLIAQIAGSRVYDRSIAFGNMPNEFNLSDLSSRQKVRKLINGRGKSE